MESSGSDEDATQQSSLEEGTILTAKVPLSLRPEGAGGGGGAD